MTLASNGLQNAVVYRWTYADAATRTAATGFVSTDVGALALQQSDNTLWMLTATTPTWVQALGVSTLTVDEVDGAPSVANVTHLTVSNGTLTDNGGGHVTVTTGGGGGGAMVQVAETILAVDTATITFSSIPGTARGLRLVFTGRSTAAVTTDSLLLRLNGDTGANYDSQKLQGNGGTVTSVESLGQTAFTMTALVGASAAANFASHFIIEINDYARTNWYKNITAMCNEKAGNGTGFIVLAQFGGGWRSTAAITSLTLSCAANLAAGTVATLYSIT